MATVLVNPAVLDDFELDLMSHDFRVWTVHTTTVFADAAAGRHADPPVADRLEQRPVERGGRTGPSSGSPSARAGWTATTRSRGRRTPRCGRSWPSTPTTSGTTSGWAACPGSGCRASRADPRRCPAGRRRRTWATPWLASASARSLPASPEWPFTQRQSISCRRGRVVQRAPQVGVLDRLLGRVLPAVALPAGDPAGDALAARTGCRCRAPRRTGRVSADSAWMAAVSSIRWLVVCGSPPNSSLACSPLDSQAPQPPGPGIALAGAVGVDHHGRPAGSAGGCGLAAVTCSTLPGAGTHKAHAAHLRMPTAQQRT